MIEMEKEYCSEDFYNERVTFTSEDTSGHYLEIAFDNNKTIREFLNEVKYFMLAQSYPEDLINEYLYDKGNGVEKIPK